MESCSKLRAASSGDCSGDGHWRRGWLDHRRQSVDHPLPSHTMKGCARYRHTRTYKPTTHEQSSRPASGLAMRTASCHLSLLWLACSSSLLLTAHAETVEADAGLMSSFLARFHGARTSHAGCLSGVLSYNNGNGRILPHVLASKGLLILCPVLFAATAL